MSDPRAEVDDLAQRIRTHYSRFLTGRSQQCLLTGHSHQAWPDISREGQLACWDDAAMLADEKWSKIFGEILPEFQALVAARLGSDRPHDLALAPNTHELVYRLASCFGAQAKVVTTDGEFHSLRRQLCRLEEEGLQVHQVPVHSDGNQDFVTRFCAALEAQRPDWAALSHVMFGTSQVIVGLPKILQTAADLAIPILVDTYHGFNVLQMAVQSWPGTTFVVGGGYKYAQMGEGACWMLLPADASKFRPRTTGWFADFEHLEAAQSQVTYSQGGLRFFGATFDPSGLYRGLWTLRWMDQMKLSTAALRRQSLLATGLLIARFDELELADHGLRLATPRADAERAGFISIETPNAKALQLKLREAGVHTDARGHLLRFGPGPYTLAKEIDAAMETLAALV